MPSARPRWRSIVLRPAVVALLLLSEVALIVVILDLLVLSSIHAGFVRLGAQNAGSDTIFSVQGALDRSQSLLWTTLPAVILTLYRLFREAAISALVVETPFIELQKSSASRRTKVRKSIYVDYRTSFSIIAWYEALKNNHTFLGLCMLFSFVVSLALVPLAGGLFVAGQESRVSDAVVNVLSTFDPSVGIATEDYGLLFDAVSASWINAAPYPPGTDGSYPVPRIEPAKDVSNYTIATSAETSQLTLDCRIVDDAIVSPEAQAKDVIQFTFNATDRECAISGDSVASTTGLKLDFLKALGKQDCPALAGLTRLMLFHVRISPLGEFENSTLISCIPSYWAINGTLSVIESVASSGSVTGKPLFSEQSRSVKELPNDQRRIFEQGLLNVQVINIGSDVNSPNRVAELTTRYIASRNLDLSGESIIESLSTVYPALYTMLCVYHFFPILKQPIQQDGILTLTEDRLHVVVPAAIAMLAIIVLLVVETTYLILYLHRHPSILAEEPVGLVGAANLLHDSNLHCLVATSHDESTFDGRLRRPSMQVGTTEKRSKTLYTDDHLRDRDCWVERDTESGRLKIVIETKEEDAGCAKLLHAHTFPGYRNGPPMQDKIHQHVTVQARPTSVSSMHSSELDHGRADRTDNAVTFAAPVQHNTNIQNRRLSKDEEASDLWSER